MRMNWRGRRQVWLATIILSTVVCGCDKKVEVPKSGASAFASAKPEVQQIWSAAAAASVKNDYLGATTNLLALQAQSSSLSSEQAAAVEELWGALGVKTFAAAEKNDPGAVEAMKAIRKVHTR